ncbi:putative nuclease HARBI1 [Hordeum vulgare]|nr:putative nuclease HARBI1 [Hordeum vulgare]
MVFPPPPSSADSDRPPRLLSLAGSDEPIQPAAAAPLRRLLAAKMKWRILGGIPWYKSEAQKMIVTTSMCLHNFLRDSKLHDEHFDKFDNDAYVQPPLSFTGANALPPKEYHGRNP